MTRWTVLTICMGSFALGLAVNASAAWTPWLAGTGAGALIVEFIAWRRGRRE